MNNSRRPTMLSHLLRMEIQVEIPQWIAQFDETGGNPESKIILAGQELASTMRRAEDISKNYFEEWFADFERRNPVLASFYPDELKPSRPAVEQSDHENDLHNISAEDAAEAILQSTAESMEPSFEDHEDHEDLLH